MNGRPGKSSRFMAALVALAAAVGGLLVPAVASTPAGAATLPRPEGAGPPVPASGMGTSAALANPKCHKTSPAGQVLAGGYGRFDDTVIGGGPVCVKAWPAGSNNGGATWQGVTKDKVTIVVVLPNDQQLQSDPVAPKHEADSSPSTYENAVHDLMLPYMKFYETWGRDIEIRFVTSSGSDETAQRADVVKVEAMKPFAVFHLVVTGLDVLETELAKDHIPVMGYSTTATKANAQAPYRWGLSDAQSSAINSAEVIGKQLLNKKAEYAGSDVKNQTRKFGVVYIKTLVDYPSFQAYFKKYGGTIASSNPYDASGSTFGDASVSNELAPTMVTRMKAAGVTTVIMLSDFSMNSALMKEATKQDWHPEWFFTGAIYADIGILSRSYPTDQSVHAFGLSFLAPYTEPDPTPPPPELPLSTKDDYLNWYWGVDAATQAGAVTSNLEWVLNGVQAAGPDLTPKTFAQGLFAIPASGGAAQNQTSSFLSGYGKGPNLPYDEYAQNGLDFAPYWWDPSTTGPSNGQGEIGKGVGWYADGAKRYKSGTWPKKQFDWFDKKTSVYHFTTRQTPAPTYAGDCQGCPSTGGPGQPDAPSNAGFIAKANGQGESSL
ncbi:MAG TPA: hypothetical protein VEP49_17940 [Acidimicrobiia bacterium]|nr:hypothetical protein [Acidimicrobiia bacterium]